MFSDQELRTQYKSKNLKPSGVDGYVSSWSRIDKGGSLPARAAQDLVDLKPVTNLNEALAEFLLGEHLVTVSIETGEEVTCSLCRTQRTSEEKKG